MTHLMSPLNWVLATLLAVGGTTLLWRMIFRDGPTRDDFTRFGAHRALSLAKDASKRGIWATIVTALGAATAGDTYGLIILWIAVAYAAVTLAYRFGGTLHHALRHGIATRWVVFWWIALTLIVALASAASQMSNAAVVAQTPAASVDGMRTAAVTGTVVILIGLALMGIHLSVRRRRHTRGRRRPGHASRARLADAPHHQNRRS